MTHRDPHVKAFLFLFFSILQLGSHKAQDVAQWWRFFRERCVRFFCFVSCEAPIIFSGRTWKEEHATRGRESMKAEGIILGLKGR